MSGNISKAVQTVLDDPDRTDDLSKAYAIAWENSEGDKQKRARLAKSAPNGSVSKMEFEISTEGSVGGVFKADDDFVIWGPASVEVVDKERDRIKADALENALPQLLKRKRLSYEHSDQIVGDILERFKTEEPVEVTVNGKSYERTDFPTDVLKLDGMKPGLFVAGNIYNDSQKSQEVRKQIEAGDIDSYSISGEATVTEMAVKDGQTFTDILKMDLSAVTLCREGMNQKAKFDTVSKTDSIAESNALNPQRAASIAKTRIQKTMSNKNDDDVQKFVKALDKTLEERLPDGELATKGDVEEMVDERLKAQEGSPAEGTPDRPDGNSDTPTNQSDEYEGDTDDWGEDPTDDPDKVEQTKSKTYSKEELKSALPDDQFKAIEPLLDEEEEDEMGGEPDIDPADEQPDEMVDPEMPDDDPLGDDEEGESDPVMASKAVDNLDWDRLSEGQKRALAKGNIEKAESTASTRGGVGGGSQPAHARTQEGSNVVAKADGDAVNADAALRNIYDNEGNPQI